MREVIEIQGRRIGAGCPCYIVAELSANHNGSFDQAVDVIRAARNAGADAIKLQTYTPDTLTIRCNNEHFRIGGGTLWDGRTLYDLYAEAYTPWDWHPKLKKIANELGLAFFSTPFDSTAVDFLEEVVGVPMYKVASFEIVDLPLIKKIASTGKPVLISTGMATLEEIEEAVATAREGGTEDIVLLKCTSAYPARVEDIHLRTIPYLTETTGLHVGLSDHTLGIAVPVAAVALGSRVIEKHLTISRAIPGPDSAFSLEPNEFAEMVNAVRIAESAIGDVHFGASPDEAKGLVFRRSLFVVREIKQGEAFTTENVRSVRPSHGLHTRYLKEILGSLAATDIAAGTPLSWNLIARVTAS
ncbi:MAG: pseudaminic acid synthase [Silvibacterium sp.]